MRLYNQSRHPLSWKLFWDGEDRKFDVEPYGAVEIEDDLVPHCTSRGLPLAVTPMSPDQRAQTVLADEQERAKADELNRTKTALSDALSGIDEARKTVERMQLSLSEAKAALGEAQDLREMSEEKARKANADRAAAEKLLEETVQKLTVAEDRAMKAEAQLAIAEKQKKPAKGESGEQRKAS